MSPDFPSHPLSERARRSLARIGPPAEPRSTSTNSDGDAPAGETDDGRAYHLTRTEDAAEGIRRVIIGRLDDAVEQLRERVADDPVTAVHEARKDLKKARSAIRLARGAVGRKRYRAANRGLRDAARELSGTRDADVRSETLRRLRETFSDELSAATATAIEAEIEAAGRAAPGGSIAAADLTDVAARAAAEIERIRAAVAGWKLSAGGWKLVGPGLERGYRRGRLEFRRVLDGPTPEAIHVWRKRAKDLWYHLRLVRRSWPKVLDATIAEAHELTDLLGDHHDLTALRDHLRSRAAGSTDADRDAEIMELIERRQEQLAEQAIPLGERLYAEKPSAFAARIARYWRAWRVD